MNNLLYDIPGRLFLFLTKSGGRQAMTIRLLLSVGVFLFWIPRAEAQFQPIPLTGGALVKMTADYQRPYIYAIQSPASGATNGNLLFINTTNGALVKTLMVGTNPTDIAVSPAGDAVFVINAGSRTISKVDLSSFTVVSEKPISTPNTYDVSNPLHLVAATPNLLYYTDGAWAPQIYSFDYTAGTNFLMFNTGGNVSDGAGGMVVAPNMNWVVYIWTQYGWSAGYVYSSISRLVAQTGGFSVVGTGSQQGRDPLDTPIFMDAAGNWVFNKAQMVLAGNVSAVVNQFSENIYAITLDGSLAFGLTKVFETQGASIISSFPSAATVQVVSGDQKKLFRFDGSTSNLLSYTVASLEAPTITQQPANQLTTQPIYSGNSATVSVSAIGLGPIYFYWNFNGNTFTRTTNAQITIASMQLTNAGTYSVIVSNAFGSVLSSNAVLSVTNSAPIFLTQPSGQTVAASSNVVFSSQIVGSQPMSFQWRFNGQNIGSGTNAILSLNNLQLSNQGNYDVVASNVFGSTSSASAYLTVVDSTIALDATNLIWTSAGDVPWFVQATPGSGDLLGYGYPAIFTGPASMQSGNTTAGQQSILQTTVAGPATLTFWWQAAAISPSDFLAFLLNGQEVGRIAAASYWSKSTVYLGAGTNLLQWNYKTDVDYLNKSAAWVDDVNVAYGGTPPFGITASQGQVASINSNATMSVTASGTPPFTYQWRLNGTNLLAATNSVLNLSNLHLSDEGYYDVVVANSFGSTNSASAFLDVVDLAQALNTTNIAWYTGGDAPWFVETEVTYDGYAALQSGTITNGQQSQLQTTITGPGLLTYWWNVSSAGANDYLNLSVNGVEQSRIFGVIIYGFYGWQMQTNYLGAGTNYLQWAYVKTDSGVSISGRDSGWVDQVAFMPGGTAPFVTLDPTSQITLLGSNATLNAAALGTPPLNYQWQLNGTNVDSATNSTLVLTNVQFAKEGNYSLVISNAFGITNSTAAFINVVDFTESLNATSLTFSSSGNRPWFPETSITHDGIAALQSGAISASQQSTVSTTVSGPGTLSFWWKISSETNNDYVNFTVDGAEQARNSGLLNQWSQKTFYLTNGTHTLAWSYSKNATVNNGSDAAWLDQVSYVPGGTAAFASSGPADQFVPLSSNAAVTVTALGTPPINYQWLFNGSAIPSATNSSLIINNVQITNSGNYSVALTNDYGNSTSSNAFLYLLNLYAWGAGKSNTFTAPTYGQSLVPTNLIGVKAIAGGGYHSMALLSSGRVLAWGYNAYGQTNNQSTLTNAAAIAAGLYHSTALRSNGTVVAWGNSTYSQTTVPTAASNVTAITAGWYHNLALRSNGTVVAWGAGTAQSFSPHLGQSLVPTNLSGVIAVAAGGFHSLALRSNGTVVAWGLNASGQTNVPIGLSNVVAIAAGASNSLALKNNGTLVAWGFNANGQTNIPADASNVVAIACGAAHVMALKNDGTLVSWGLSGNGQTNAPANAVNVAAIAAGGYHSLALLNVGPVTFLNPPYNQTVFKGSNAFFNPAVLGLAPMTFQWLQNGTNVLNGTNAVLTFNGAQLSDTGNYQLLASNSFGAVTSAAAVLTVNDTAPFITLQPTNVAVLQNSNFIMTATAGGLPPFAYQWRFNGASITYATNAILTVTNAQLTNEGFYSLLVSNASGTAVSSNAFVDVIDLPQALGLTNVSWFNPGTPGWFAESNTTHDGFAAASSGLLPYGYQNMLRTYVNGPGKLSFWCNGTLNVTLTFAIDDVQQINQQLVSGSGWRQFTYYLPATAHAITWTAANQYSSSFNNVAFLDDVVFTPGITSASFTTQPASQTVAAGNNVTFNVAMTGTPPFTYQWYFNGGAIPRATSSSLTLNDVQSAAAGVYSVVVSGPGNTVFSSNAVLSVPPSAPVVNSQPAGGSVLLGGAITFSGSATGTEPLFYQWLYNNLPLSGATGTSLTVSNVQYANAGNYTLLASNSVGTAASSKALLAPYSLGDLGASLDNPGLTWSTTNVPWFPQTNTTYDGLSAAQSGAISGNQSSTLRTIVTGPAMVIYWWKVNCDSFWVNLAFSANGTIQSAIAGSVDWQPMTNYIGSGSQTLQWNLYPIHNAFSGGTGWLDQVQVIPVPGMAVAITNQTGDLTINAGNNVSFSVGAGGTPALAYQWLFNGTNLPGATSATFTLLNVQAANAGTYSVLVTNDYGSAVGSNATLTVNPSAPVITSQPASQTNIINSTTTFSVGVKGTPPYTYQWYFNSVAIPGANSSSYVLPAPQLTNGGNYSVIVSNQYGQVTSGNARLILLLSKVVEYWPSSSFIPFTPPYATPTNVGNATAIAVGASHAMALRTDGTVLAWGNNFYGQTNVPVGLSNVIAIAAGNYNCLTLKADGTLVAWGDYSYGQGGVPPGLSNVMAIAAGPTYNLALKYDGTVFGWGYDNNGQIDIPAGLTNVVAIFAGYYNGFARQADGSIVQWGNAPVWQHNGTNTQLQIAGGMSNVVAVAAGGFSGWSLQDDNSVLAYGWYDGVSPVVNGYNSMGFSSTGVRSRSVYSDIYGLAAFGNSNPFYDYAILLSSSGQITQVGGLAGPGGVGASFVPYITGNPGYVTAVAAGFQHAAVLVGDGSPHSTWAPISRVVFSGTTVSFSSSASGKPPLNYQWQFNGTNLDAATNATLVLTNIPLSAAGNYSCIITNTVGATTNLNTILTVLRSTLRFSGAPVFSGSGFGWQLDQLSGHGNIIILASSNLLDWAPIYTNPPVTGVFQFLDSTTTNQPARFYRAVEQ